MDIETFRRIFFAHASGADIKIPKAADAAFAGLMIDVAKHGGLPWDAILGAELAHAYKPSPKVYTDAVEVLGVAPAEVCLVAAHNGDLAAARQLGLATAFVLRPTEHGPNQTTDLQADDAWDFDVRDLNELADRLGCPD